VLACVKAKAWVLGIRGLLEKSKTYLKSFIENCISKPCHIKKRPRERPSSLHGKPSLPISN
jgi:hypothetical protein